MTKDVSRFQDFLHSSLLLTDIMSHEGVWWRSEIGRSFRGMFLKWVIFIREKICLKWRSCHYIDMTFYFTLTLSPAKKHFTDNYFLIFWIIMWYNEYKNVVLYSYNLFDIQLSIMPDFVNVESKMTSWAIYWFSVESPRDTFEVIQHDRLPQTQWPAPRMITS